MATRHDTSNLERRGHTFYWRARVPTRFRKVPRQARPSPSHFGCCLKPFLAARSIGKSSLFTLSPPVNDATAEAIPLEMLPIETRTAKRPVLNAALAGRVLPLDAFQASYKALARNNRDN